MAATYAQRMAVGDYGERLAARYLSSRGLVVVDRNWRCSRGEIDIVALEDETLVVVEVKTRVGDRFGTPLEAVTAEKAARLHRLGRLWLQEHPQRTHRLLRLDVVAVRCGRRGAAQIEHMRGMV